MKWLDQHRENRRISRLHRELTEYGRRFNLPDSPPVKTAADAREEAAIWRRGGDEQMAEILDRCALALEIRKVRVVVADCGLNGPAVLGVFIGDPTPAALDRLIDERLRNHGSLPTGYGGCDVITCEIEP